MLSLFNIQFYALVGAKLQMHNLHLLVECVTGEFVALRATEKDDAMNSSAAANAKGTRTDSDM